MTPKKAIQLLRQDIPPEGQDKEKAQAYRLAIDALERGIPKKPIYNYVIPPEPPADYCPRCSTRLYEKTTCCPDCGQRISKKGRA